jgi:hypothetical protein
MQKRRDISQQLRTVDALNGLVRLFLGAGLAWLLAITATVLSAETRIELQDGSVISGEVLSSDGQRYRIRSETLGTLDIDAGQIRSLQSATAPSHASNPAVGQQIESLQKHITQDQNLLGTIMALQTDPDIRRILEDDELLNAIARRDIEQLRQHPSIQKLLDNPRMRAIIEQFKGP